VWSPRFTAFLHEYLQSISVTHNTETNEIAKGRTTGASTQELSVGHVLQAALQQGLRMQSVIFSNGFYIDVGTPQGLDRALRTVLSEETSIPS
jgi:glucose-1-phosphate thymidylyltransferase